MMSYIGYFHPNHDGLMQNILHSAKELRKLQEPKGTYGLLSAGFNFAVYHF